MLTLKQISEIKSHLERAQNPIFFFDNDADGLCSFLLLQRWLDRGKGVAIRSFPGLTKEYFRKVHELNADYIFILDKPLVDDDFFEEAKQANIPVVCIDHHDVPGFKIDNYYNTFHESGKNEPVSYLCYKITEQKKDMWLAAAGCIGDCFVPDFFEEFAKENSDLVDCDYKTAFDVLYKCKLGKLIMIFNLGLKDSTTNIVAMQKFLMKAQFASEVFEENSKTRSFLKRYEQLNGVCEKLLAKAEKEIKGNFLFSHMVGG